MKREMNELNIRDIFRPMPEKCHQALMDAARSVKEEQPVKRVSYRALVIAAIIIVATMAVAIAVSRLGWLDYYQSNYNVSVPKAAQEALEATASKTYQVGPMTFTFNQLLCDGRIALSAAETRTTDGTEALYAPSSDYYEAVDAQNDAVLKRYSLASGTTWMEAAIQLNLPLYGVRSLIELDPALSGNSMEDTLWNDDSSIVYFNMAPLTSRVAQGELDVELYMSVTLFDPKTEQETERWTTQEPVRIAISPMLNERLYAPEGNATIAGVTLTRLHAEQYITGWYLFADFTVPDGMGEEAALDKLHSIGICDESGLELPYGLSLSSGVNVDALPTATREITTSLETLPDTLVVTTANSEEKIVLK